MMMMMVMTTTMVMVSVDESNNKVGSNPEKWPRLNEKQLFLFYVLTARLVFFVSNRPETKWLRPLCAYEIAIY